MDITEIESQDIETKLTTIANAGELDALPDIFLIQDASFQKFAQNYPEIFTDLTDSGIDFSQFSAAKTSYSIVNGKNMGIPFDSGTAVNCIRTDYLEQAGFTVEDFTDITWSDYMEKAKIVKEKTGQPMLTAKSATPDIIMMMLQSCGASLFLEDGSPNLDQNDVLKECMSIYVQMVKDKTLEEMPGWDQYIASINNGTVASAMNGCWIIASVEAKEDQSGKWAVTNLPRLTAHQTQLIIPATAVQHGRSPPNVKTKNWLRISLNLLLQEVRNFTMTSCPKALCLHGCLPGNHQFMNSLLTFLAMMLFTKKLLNIPLRSHPV